jgi:hypothetical protein
MRTRDLILACVLLIGGTPYAVGAEGFEIKLFLFRGDPNGSREAGTQERITAPTLGTLSGEEGRLLVGGEVQVGQRLVPVGHQVAVTATDAKGGAIIVKAVLEHSQAIGPVGAQQVTSTKTATTATIQPGGRVRLELGKDPKDRHWVEITVRKAK